MSAIANHLEETLDSLVQRQSYIEDAYNSVSELLELCKELQGGFNSALGMIHPLFGFQSGDYTPLAIKNALLLCLDLEPRTIPVSLVCRFTVSHGFK